MAYKSGDPIMNEESAHNPHFRYPLSSDHDPPATLCSCSDYKANLTDPLPRPHEGKVESSAASHNLRTLAPRPRSEPEKKEARGDTARSEEVERLWREVGYLKG